MSEWIKCSERLPEPGVPVDIWVPDEQHSRLADYILRSNYAGVEGNSFFEPLGSGRSCVRNATHWMPLPEPPQDA